MYVYILPVIDPIVQCTSSLSAPKRVIITTIQLRIGVLRVQRRGRVVGDTIAPPKVFPLSASFPTLLLTQANPQSVGLRNIRNTEWLESRCRHDDLLAKQAKLGIPLRAHRRE